MSSDQNAPEAFEYQGQQALPPQQDHNSDFAGSSSAPGMGLSKSSRRRRRKRKGKGDGPDSGPSGQDFSGSSPAPQVVPSMQAASQPQAFQPQPQQGGGQQGYQGGGGQQQNGAGGKRWKKKFRDRDRQRFSDNPSGGGNGGNSGVQNAGGQPRHGGGFRDRDTHQPGNTISGFKRKGGGGGGGKQRDRGPRSFVGPMDHSYRVANGNFADAPPSTIETHGGHRGGGRSYVSDSQPIDYSQGRTIPIPEDAPSRIFFFVDDLFLVAKINETTRKLGVKVSFLKNDKESIAALLAMEEADRPALIVFDLNNLGAKPLTLIPKIKAKLKKSTSVIGFLSHLQGDLKAKAVEAGCDTVMPRAAFSQNLPNLLRRYGMEEEDENSNFNR